MSTQHDIEKEAGALSWTSPPVQDEQVFPAQTFPQPPQRPPRPKRNLWIVITALLMTLVLLLSLGIIFIPGLIQHPGGQVTPTPTSPSTQITPTTAPMTPTVPTTPAATPTTGPGITPTPTQGVVWAASLSGRGEQPCLLECRYWHQLWRKAG